MTHVKSTKCLKHRLKHRLTQTHTQPHLSDQSEGAVKAPGVGVLSDFVVEPAELGQSAADVPQGLAHHYLRMHSGR